MLAQQDAAFRAELERAQRELQVRHGFHIVAMPFHEIPSSPVTVCFDPILTTMSYTCALALLDKPYLKAICLFRCFKLWVQS